MPEGQRENFLSELLKFALVALIIVVPVRMFVAQPFIVRGASMDPTFETDQYLIVDEISYYFEKPERGDVVIFKYPRDPKQYFIKRVIGLPNETVTIENGVVSVTDKEGIEHELQEPYITFRGNGGNLREELGSGEYFVMGDNRPESSDSRSWGVLPEENIVGRAFVRLLPLSSLSLFPGNADVQ